MTHPFLQKQLRFFLTSPAPCPYLPDREERKVFTHLQGSQSRVLNDALTQVGFRRSQTIAYRPACETCNACLSARIRVADFKPSASLKRVASANQDVITLDKSPNGTEEQYNLLTTYLEARHKDGGMADMSFFDYIAMIEETSVDTHITEYRQKDNQTLLAMGLIDRLSDGLSLVYSFFDPDQKKRSLGTYLILHAVEQAQRLSLPYVYLGYWVEGSEKMAYKSRFKPLEILGPDGVWQDL